MAPAARCTACLPVEPTRLTPDTISVLGVPRFEDRALALSNGNAAEGRLGAADAALTSIVFRRVTGPSRLPLRAACGPP